MTIHASLAFAKYTDSEIDPFTEGVITSLDGNQNFPSPIVPVAALQAALAQYRAAMAGMAQGGKQATALKNAMREEMLTLLRKEALYVQNASGNDLPVLLSSGFEAASTNRAQTPLDKPTIMDIQNNASTQLQLRLTTVLNARAYEVQIKTGTGDWTTAGLFTRSRRIVVADLTPGTTYTFQARAIGGSTGYSDWSDPVSHMAM
jgi:hypothetical protein